MTSLKSLIPAQIKTPRLLLELFDGSTAHYDCMLKCLNSKSAHSMMGDFGLRNQDDIDKMLSVGNLQPSAFEDQANGLILDAKIIYIIHEGHAQGPMIGTITLPQRTPAFPPDIGWLIHDDFQRRGYAPEAAKVVLDMLQTIGIKRVMAWPGNTNYASIAVAKKIGMVQGPTQKSKDGEDLMVYVLPGMEMDGGMLLSVSGG